MYEYIYNVKGNERSCDLISVPYLKYMSEIHEQRLLLVARPISDQSVIICISRAHLMVLIANFVVFPHEVGEWGYADKDNGQFLKVAAWNLNISPGHTSHEFNPRKFATQIAIYKKEEHKWLGAFKKSLLSHGEVDKTASKGQHMADLPAEINKWYDE